MSCQRMKQSQPLNESDLNPMSPKHHESPPHRSTSPQVSSIPKKPLKTNPHSANSTHSPAPSTPPHPAPHHTVQSVAKAKAPPNVTPASAHKCNRADTTEQCAHNGTPDPTPRQNKLTRQEVPSQRQAPGTGVPHHAPRSHTNTPHHHHCNNSPGRNIK
ncbi:hypothetical protein ILYODFUR_019913 [Ilyodon furcidens]|uniref:Uncharacterized protein n=1 Tax=Ilyodon furcidens TaxID=33524 RepID=A0ABV0T9J0_9TELE